MKDYKLELIRQTPIQYGELTIYPISLKEICDTFGLDLFNNLLTPFCLTKDCFDVKEEDYENVNLFSDVILKDEMLLSYIGIILKSFCKAEDVRLYNDTIIVITKDGDNSISFEINAKNFDDIAEIIRKINNKDLIKVEKPPKNMSERQIDVWKKLREGRMREAKKNEIHIYDMLNVCEFGGNYRIPIEEIEKWTLWRIANCYNSRTSIKSYDDNLKICLVTGNSEEISGKKHWHQQLMIRD